MIKKIAGYARELIDGRYAEEPEIRFDGFPDAGEISQPPINKRGNRRRHEDSVALFHDAAQTAACGPVRDLKNDRLYGI